MRVKGTAIAPLPKFIKEKYGEDKFKLWLDSLSPEAQEIYKKEILVSKWYPLDQSYVEPMEKVCKLFFNNDRMACGWEIGRCSAEYGLKGIYGFLLKLGSASFMVKRAGSILANYYENSKISVAEADEHHVVVQILEFPQISDFVEYRIAGWSEKAIQITGCKNVQAKITKSLFKGDNCTEIVVTWE